MPKLIAHVSGKVQMAGYRSRVVIIAKAFNLKGYVRNLPDGRVKIVAEGSQADLERFLEAIRIENTLIKVEEIKAEFSDATGAYEDFFEMEGELETDVRPDVAAEQLKDLIVIVKEGFKETVSKLAAMDSRLKEISSKQDELKEAITVGFRETGASLKEISGKQDLLIDKMDETRGEIVSDVHGLRSDLKGRTEERLQRIESDVVEIKARMRP